MEDRLHILFCSDWHAGSGLGESHLADAVLNRDADGIPILTGRTVKGALREGAWRLSQVAGRDDLKDAVEEFWGGMSTREDRPAGRLFVSPAELPRDVRDWLLSLDRGKRAECVSLLASRRAQTAIEAGVARKGSLRTIECGMPGLEFTARIFLDVPAGEEDWCRRYMACVCAAVKSMGASRARGLGQCLLFLEGGTAGRVALPPRRQS